MTPSIALAATVAGEARKTSACDLPMRPLKLRLDELMHRSPGATRTDPLRGPALRAFRPIAPGSVRTLHPMYCLGSAIMPAIADAATVAGDARNTSACDDPIRFLKFRLDDEMQRSPGARMPPAAPMHGPQPGVPTTAPARMSLASVPSSIAASIESLLAGVTMRRTSGWT